MQNSASLDITPRHRAWTTTGAAGCAATAVAMAKQQEDSSIAALALAQAWNSVAAAIAARNARRATTPRAKACIRTAPAVRGSAAVTSAWRESPATLLMNDRVSAATERAWVYTEAPTGTQGIERSTPGVSWRQKNKPFGRVNASFYLMAPKHWDVFGMAIFLDFNNTF